MLPVSGLLYQSFALERQPTVKPTGFREYDARWLFGSELNLVGVHALGLGLGTLLRELGIKPELVTGHDFRTYSSLIKYALISGLMAAGVKVHDIGLALPSMAYFAQFALDVPVVAMISAPHSDNGWTGVRLGAQHSMTFGPDEMARLSEIVLEGKGRAIEGGSHQFVDNFGDVYFKDLMHRPQLGRDLKVVTCGNGTAGAFVPRLLESLGCKVVPLDTKADLSFPRYDTNLGGLHMLETMAEKVRETGADAGFGFDGDGDHCSVVDNEGHQIFADKVGVMLARDLSAVYPGATFVVDVKSTGLFATDPILLKNGIRTDYWTTGPSHIKRRVFDLKALAGFEKSGHFFFNQPIGGDYDDGLLTAIAVLDMLDRNPSKTVSDLYHDMPKTWDSPALSPHCDDEKKYDVVDKVATYLKAAQGAGQSFGGQAICDLNTVDGVRATMADGTWGLVRAACDKPELIVMIESPVSKARMREMFHAIDALIRQSGEVGAYDQSV